MILARPRALLFVALAFIAAVYLHHLPRTVQSGDSGELVAAAYRLWVPHPPGYPLYVWLQHAWLAIGSPSSVFFKASLLNALLALSVLALIAGRARSFAGAALVVALGFSQPFWKYAMIPDVFALNAFFAAAILFFYLAPAEDLHVERWEAKRSSAVSILFGFALANHLTIVFLAPVVLHAFWEARRSTLAWLGAIVGAAVAFGFYASLFLLDTSGIYSWGEISTWGDLARHFLRHDYGTFRLAPSGESSYFATLAWFAGKVAGDFWMLLVAAAFAAPLMKREGPNRWHVSRRDAGAKVVLLSFALYVLVFFALANVDPKGMGAEVLERFFILPVVLLLFPLARALDNSIDGINDPRARKALLFVLACVLLNPVRHWRESDFRRDTIVEDYGRNILAMAEEGKPTIFLAGTDTELFAVRYVQAIGGAASRVFPVTDVMLLHPWQVRKIQRALPEFTLDAGKAAATKKLEVIADLFEPNLDRVAFLATSPLPESFGMTFRALGRLPKREKGVAFDEASLALLKFRERPEIPSGGQFDPTKFSTELFLQAKYAHFHLARGLERFRANDLEGAAREYFAALAKVPFCKPAVANLCELQRQAQGRVPELAAFDCKGATEKIAGFYDYF